MALRASSSRLHGRIAPSSSAHRHIIRPTSYPLRAEPERAVRQESEPGENASGTLSLRSDLAPGSRTSQANWAIQGVFQHRHQQMQHLQRINVFCTLYCAHGACCLLHEYTCFTVTPAVDVWLRFAVLFVVGVVV